MLGLAARLGAACIAVACSLLAGCGGSDTQSAAMNTSTARGTLLYDPPFRIASLDAATFASQVGATAQGQTLLAITGTPKCGIDFYHIEYNTVGGAGETTTASGALMVPTGAAGTCSGPRPIVLYAHGTQTDKTADLSNIVNPNNTEGALIAATFAAQGYIVVAPNYAGYDTSSLPYHPFVNGDQQSKDMIDALAAGRAALPNVFSAATSDSGKLFVTGYSQGGYVAMATVKAMQALQTPNATVVASAPMSGPYALEAFADYIFLGHPDVGSTVFADLVATSYQKAYGNVYASPTDLFDPTYAADAVGLLPSATPVDTLFAQNKLPETALFNINAPTGNGATLDAALAVPTNPLYASGFGSPSLITNSYRVAYAADALQNIDGVIAMAAGAPLATSPQHPLRQDLAKNDLRSFAPASPMLLCGGDQDPTVFFPINTLAIQAYWTAQGVPAQLVTVLDVNAAPTGATDPFAAAKVGFQEALAALLASGGETAVVENYHTTVAPFCTVAARGFFNQF